MVALEVVSGVQCVGLVWLAASAKFNYGENKLASQLAQAAAATTTKSFSSVSKV